MANKEELVKSAEAALQTPDLIAVFAVSTAITGVLLASHQYLSNWVDAQLRTVKAQSDDELPLVSELNIANPSDYVRDHIEIVKNKKEEIQVCCSEPAGWVYGNGIAFWFSMFRFVEKYLVLALLVYVASATWMLLHAVEDQTLDIIVFGYDVMKLRPRDIVFTSAFINIIVAALMYIANRYRVSHMKKARQLLDDGSHSVQILKSRKVI